MLDINKQRQCNVCDWSHDQNIHFDNGEKLLIQNVKWVWEMEMVHIVDAIGVEYVINKHRILYFEKLSKGKEQSRGKGSKRSKRGAKKQA